MCANHQEPELPPMKTGLRGLCPRCGTTSMFQGFLTLKKQCEACKLDYTFADPADGPAFFVICFGCVPAALLGVLIEVKYAAPYWVHLFTTLPAVLITCIPPLRPLKGWLVASQYYHRAEEGRLVRSAPAE